MRKIYTDTKTDSEKLFAYLASPIKTIKQTIDAAVVASVHNVLLQTNYFVRAYDKYKATKSALYPSEGYFKSEKGGGHDMIKFMDCCSDLHDGYEAYVPLHRLQSLIASPVELIAYDDDNHPENNTDNTIQDLDFVDFDFDKLVEQEGPLMSKVWLHHFNMQIEWCEENRDLTASWSVPEIINPKWFGYEKIFADLMIKRMNERSK